MSGNMVLPYSEKVIEHFKRPRNVGRIENPDAKATAGSPACGDMVTVYLRVDPKDLRIEDIKFESYGCASNIATGSIITELAKGRTLEEAKKITWQRAAEELGGLPPVKMHCSILAVDTLRAAIRNYEERHGLIPREDRLPTDETAVRERLEHVMNPLTGFDIVKADLVKSIRVEDEDGKRVISVELDLSQDNPFSRVIEEEIHERLDHLWDVKRVEITFTE